MISIKHDLGDLIGKMNDLEKRQLPFATSLAINRTAQKVKQAEEREMKDVFDRPTPYTLSSVFMKPSTKASLAAVVGLKDRATKAVPASKFLRAQITGGSRHLKKYEVALRSVGALPPGYFTVPGEAATLDAYGNIARSQVIQILSFFRAFPDAGYRANSTEATRAKMARGTKRKMGASYFVGSPGDGKLPLGIWMRVHSGFGSALRPILIFVPHAQYQPIFDLSFVAETVIKKEYPAEFSRALAEAVRTAK